MLEPSPDNSSAKGKEVRVTFSEESEQATVTHTEIQTISPTSQPTNHSSRPIIRYTLARSPSTESHDNPFTDDGELSQAADLILKHSTISRTKIIIHDPTLTPPKSENGVNGGSPVHEETIAPVQDGDLKSQPAQSPNKSPTKPKENGNVDDAAPQEVEVEVDVVSPNEQSNVEKVTLPDKKPKCKCCVVM